MQTISEIKEEFEDRFSSEAKEILLFKEIPRYYKKKRILIPMLLFFISITVFSFLEDIFLFFGEEYPKLLKEFSIKVVVATTISLIIAFLIPIFHVILKREKGKYEEIIEAERIKLVKKEVERRNIEIERLIEEENELKDYIIEQKAERDIIESIM